MVRDGETLDIDAGITPLLQLHPGIEKDLSLYTVVLSARVKGRKLETRWNFTVDRA
jgi:hypothetical protein